MHNTNFRLPDSSSEHDCPTGSSRFDDADYSPRVHVLAYLHLYDTWRSDATCVKVKAPVGVTRLDLDFTVDDEPNKHNVTQMCDHYVTYLSQAGSTHIVSPSNGYCMRILTYRLRCPCILPETDAARTYRMDADAAQTYHVDTDAARTYHVDTEAVRTYHVDTDAARTYHVHPNAVQTYHIDPVATRTYHVCTESARIYHVDTEAARAYQMHTDAVQTYHEAARTYRMHTEAARTYHMDT